MTRMASLDCFYSHSFVQRMKWLYGKAILKCREWSSTSDGEIDRTLVDRPVSQREEWIDRCRGLCMFSIVAFHVIGAFQSCFAETAADAVKTIRDCIEHFHVAGFFVIAGLLWHSGISWSCFIRRKAKRLLVPYFLFGFLWATLFAVGGGYFLRKTTGSETIESLASWKPFVSVLMANGWPDGIGSRVINALWFLPCFFLVEGVYFWIDRMIPDSRCHLAIVPLCYAVNRCFPMQDMFWHAHLLPRYMMFFILGRVVLNGLRGRMNRVVEAVFLVVSVLFAYNPRLLETFATAIGFAQWRHLMYVMAWIFVCMIVARMLPLRCLAVLGTSTMGVLVMHKGFILPFQLLQFPAISNSFIGILMVLSLTVGVCLISVVGTLVLRRLCPWAIGESARRKRLNER